MSVSVIQSPAPIVLSCFVFQNLFLSFFPFFFPCVCFDNLLIDSVGLLLVFFANVVDLFCRLLSLISGCPTYRCETQYLVCDITRDTLVLGQAALDEVAC